MENSEYNINSTCAHVRVHVRVHYSSATSIWQRDFARQYTRDGELPTTESGQPTLYIYAPLAGIFPRFKFAGVYRHRG